MKRMKKSYASPEFEIVQFQFTDVVSYIAPSQTPETPIDDNEFNMDGNDPGNEG